MITYYKVLNSMFAPVPKLPFKTQADAVQHINSLLEQYKGPFYIQEINIVYHKEK